MPTNISTKFSRIQVHRHRQLRPSDSDALPSSAVLISLLQHADHLCHVPLQASEQQPIQRSFGRYRVALDTTYNEIESICIHITFHLSTYTNYVTTTKVHCHVSQANMYFG